MSFLQVISYAILWSFTKFSSWSCRVVGGSFTISSCNFVLKTFQLFHVIIAYTEIFFVFSITQNTLKFRYFFILQSSHHLEYVISDLYIFFQPSKMFIFEFFQICFISIWSASHSSRILPRDFSTLVMVSVCKCFMSFSSSSQFSSNCSWKILFDISFVGI